MIGICLFTSMKEGTANLEKIGSFSLVWKGSRDKEYESIVEEWLKEAERFDPWEEHGALFMRNGRIFFFGWKVEMQGGIFISIPIIEDQENRKKFVALVWNFLRSTSKYWDELVEEVIDFTILDKIDLITPTPVVFQPPTTTCPFETFNEFAIIFWNILEIQPFILLNANMAKVGKKQVEIEMRDSILPMKPLQQTIVSPSLNLRKVGYLLLNYLSSIPYIEREKHFKNFIPLLEELGNLKNEKPSIKFVSKFCDELAALDPQILETLTQEAISDFIVEKSKIENEDIYHSIHLAELLHKLGNNETSFMIMGSTLELVLERKLMHLLKEIGETISKWGGQQTTSFLEALSVNFPAPEGETREVLAEIYQLFVEKAKTRDEILSLANALCTIGYVEEAIQLRLRDFNEINEEMESIELLEILTWISSLDYPDDKSLADLLASYLISALEHVPAGPILLGKIDTLYLQLVQSSKKRILLSFTLAIVNNIEKVPVLEQVKVLRIIKNHLDRDNDFLDLVAIINAKLLDLIFEEDEDDVNLLNDLLIYIKDRNNHPELALPVIERLIVTAGKNGKYNLYLQILSLTGNFISVTEHRYQIFKAMHEAAIEAEKREFLIQGRYFCIQIYYDIMDMSILNEDVEILSYIMETAINAALSVKDEKSLITFYRIFFTIRQMAKVPWVGNLLQLLDELAISELFETAKTLVSLSIKLNHLDSSTKEQILKKQLELEQKNYGYLSAEELVQVKQDLIEIYRTQDRVEDVLEELKTGHRELIQKGEAELAYHLAIEGIDLIGNNGDRNQKIQFSEMIIKSFLRMIENYENSPTVQNASTFISYAPKIIEHTSLLPSEKLIEMIELAVDELLIAYIRNRERKHIEYAQILMITFGRYMQQDHHPSLIRIFTKILETKQKFEIKYSSYSRFMDRLRFYQAIGRKDESIQDLRSLLQTYKRNVSKRKGISSELLVGLYVIGSYYYIMDCEFDDNCKNELSNLTQTYLESIMGLIRFQTPFAEKISELYTLIQQNPSEIRTLVFHVDNLIREIEGNPVPFST